MKAYHGTNKIFQHFDLRHQGEGEGGDLLVKGVYNATTISVADDYRKKVATPGSAHTDHCYFSDDVSLPASETDKISQLLAIRDDSDTPEAMRDKAVDELALLGAHDPVLMAGAVYETIVPDRQYLLHWEGGLNDQPFNVVEFMRQWYGEDEIEEIYEEAVEDSPISDLDEFDRVFENALLCGVKSMRYELRQIAPDFDWQRLDTLMGAKCPDLHPGEDTIDVGRTLYATLRHVEGGDEGAAKHLARYGVYGVISNHDFTGFEGESEVVVIWDENEIKINDMLSPGQIDMARDRERQKQATHNPGMSFNY